MAAFRISGGVLQGRVIASPGGPDNSLPQPPLGNWDGAPPLVDNSLPPPPGIWPPPVEIWPPVQLPPGYPGTPGSIWPPVINNALPRPPANVDNTLPGSQPGVDNTLPGSQPGVDNTLPGSQPGVDNTLPGSQPGVGNSLPSQKYLVAIVAASAAGGLQVIGYTVVDPSLNFWGGSAPPNVDNTLPADPAAQPKA